MSSGSWYQIFFPILAAFASPSSRRSRRSSTSHSLKMKTCPHFWKFLGVRWGWISQRWKDQRRDTCDHVGRRTL